MIIRNATINDKDYIVSRNESMQKTISGYGAKEIKMKTFYLK